MPTAWGYSHLCPIAGVGTQLSVRTKESYATSILTAEAVACFVEDVKIEFKRLFFTPCFIVRIFFVSLWLHSISSRRVPLN